MLNAASPLSDATTPGPAPALLHARQQFAHWQAQLQARALHFRAPPPEPSSCCGRGCNGCVWEGFYAAAQWWCEDAQALLAQA